MPDPLLTRAAKDFKNLSHHLGRELPVSERITHSNWYRDIPQGAELEQWLISEAKRCTDCGIPFCTRPVGTPTVGHQGCSLNNPHQWLTEAAKGNLHGAVMAHNQTTVLYPVYGALCYAPCMIGCDHSADSGTVGYRSARGAVNIKDIELGLGLLAIRNDWLCPPVCLPSNGHTVGIVGLGVAGFEAAYFLRMNGYRVIGFDALDAVGGIARYEIPAYKMPKYILDHSVEVLGRIGVEFVLNHRISSYGMADDILNECDAVIVCAGAPRARYGARGSNANFTAFPHLVSGASQLLVEIERANNSGNANSLKGQSIIVNGNKLTAADVVGKAIRAGADVTVVDWYPVDLHRLASRSSAHEELVTLVAEYPHRFRVIGNVIPDSIRDVDGRAEIVLKDRDTGSTQVITGDRVAMAIGYDGADPAIHEHFGLTMKRGLVEADRILGTTINPKVFCAGDGVHGASVLVDAAAAGARVAAVVDCAIQKKRIGPDIFSAQQVFQLDADAGGPEEAYRSALLA